MTAPVLADEAAEALQPAFPGAFEAALLAAMLAPLQRMVDVILDEDGPYASVFNRTIADPAPLAWGAQWAGMDATGKSEAQLRDASFIRSRWRRGTIGSIRSAIQSVLTGSKNVRIYERKNPADFSIDEPFHITVVTTTSETPGGADSIIEALKPVLPAFLVLHVAVVDGMTWADLHDTGKTWAQVMSGYVDWKHVSDGVPI